MPGLGCAILEDVRAVIGDCHRCDLGATRGRIVFGSGASGARVMFVGEAPGKNEDASGEPFVGAAGRFLDELLGHAGLARDEVFIANILKCRPPRNRNPAAVEIETCTPFLREQIRLVAPEVLVTLGNFSTRFVLDTREPITQLRGTVRRAGSYTVFPIFHPAAAIYDRSKRETLIADFERLGELLAMMTAGTSVDYEGPVAPAPDLTSPDRLVVDPGPPADSPQQGELFR